MNRQAYSKAYNQSKQQLRSAIQQELKQMSPERLAELKARALRELNEPPKPRIVTRYPTSLRPTLNIDAFILRHHTQSHLVHTKDCFGDEHLYFESLDGETPEQVLTRRHPKFAERREEVVNVEECKCLLCQNPN